MTWIILVSFLSLTISPAVKSSCCACLPKGIQPADVVSYGGAKPGAEKGKPAITVKEKLASLKARCKNGRLVDGAGKQIYFFHLEGCWGNPPENYQEILEKQNRELIRLKKRYTVIEMTCNPSGEPIS